MTESSEESTKYEPQKRTSGDTAHLVASGLLSLIPGAAELFQYLVPPPLEKRQAKWMEKVAQALRDFEKNQGARFEDYVLSKERKVMIATVSVANSQGQAFIERPRTEAIYEILFDGTGDFSRVESIPNKEQILFPPTAEIQGGTRPAGKRSVTFAVAFPSKPIVLVTPRSEKPCSITLSSVSTTGFTVNMWDVNNHPVNDISFNWMALFGD